MEQPTPKRAKTDEAKNEEDKENNASVVSNDEKKEQNGDKKVILVDKPIGMTPLQAIQLLKEQFPELENQKMGYAGRLDPMAHGLLILLNGDNVKLQKEHELMRKEYHFEVLFGVQTDTFDILGLPSLVSSSLELPNMPQDLVNQIKQIAAEMQGKQKQSYPPYSSARVKGKPLFHWAKLGKLDEITIPTIDIEIFSLDFLQLYQLSAQEVTKIIFERISKLTSGEFRQHEIQQKWKELLEHQLNSDKVMQVCKMKATVSPGTYIRTIAKKMGDRIGVGAIAFDIYRTKAGNFSIEQAISL